MDREEIDRCLDVSSNHSVTVDVRDVDEAPGFVRTVTMHRDRASQHGVSITIEYPPATEYIAGDFEGGGLRFMAEYAHRDDAIRDLEEFLRMDISSWKNFVHQPHTPAVIEEAPFTPENTAHFEAMVRERAVVLPRSTRFAVGGMYWEHIALWGEFRQDWIGEETAIRLRARGIPDDE